MPFVSEGTGGSTRGEIRFCGLENEGALLAVVWNWNVMFSFCHARRSD